MGNAMTDWRAKTVRQRAVSELLAYARNAKVHPEAQVAQIAASIQRFGFYAPVLVDEADEVIAGHGRLLAARKLGMRTVPTIVREGLTAAEKKALRLADNQIAANGSWDQALLGAEISALKVEGFDLALTGFDTAAVDVMLGVSAPAPLEEPKARKELPEIPKIARLGDIWSLGDHRLLCGSSTDGEAVSRLMDGQRAALCFTSPPYGNQREYTTGGISDWDELMRGVFRHLEHVLAPDGQALVNLGLVHIDQEWIPYWHGWIEWMRALGWNRFGWYVWDQGPALPGDWNGRLGPSFEFVFHFNRKPRQPNKTVDAKWSGHAYNETHGGIRTKDGTVGKWNGSGGAVQGKHIPDNVLRITRHKARGIEVNHPAVFPVKLPQFCMEAYTAPGDVVFEPFSGSGTTIVAGEECGRVVRAVELAPEYVDLAIARYRGLFPDRPVLLIDHAGRRPLNFLLKDGLSIDVVNESRRHEGAGVGKPSRKAKVQVFAHR
jgi:DNA modification methylase